MSTLKSKWSQFLNIFCDPWVIFFLISTVILFIIKPEKSENTSDTTLLTDAPATSGYFISIRLWTAFAVHGAFC